MTTPASAHGRAKGVRMFAELMMRAIRRQAHQHQFVRLESNPYIRECACGRREFLFHKHFPAVGEPALLWKPVNPGKYDAN